MAAFLPDGATLALATAYGSNVTVSAISNANPGVISAAAHGLTTVTFYELTSGWQKLTGRVFRVGTSTTGTIDLTGVDTTSTSVYPAGAGAGTLRSVSTWTPITQVMDFTTSGGDQQFANYSFLDEDFERQLPSITGAQTITIGIADDISLPGYAALKTAAEARAVRALRMTLPSGSVIVYNGFVSFNETPSVTKGSVMQVTATFSLSGRPVRY